MARVFVSAGSNIDPRANLETACGALQQYYGELDLSPLYQSAAEGFSGPDFLNLVAGFETTESPGEIRKRLAELEAQSGRDRSGGKFSSRTLDLDLLLHGERIDASLKLPHPDIEDYAFVLKPLADLAPDLRHPLSGATLAELWRSFSGPRGIRSVRHFMKECGMPRGTAPGAPPVSCASSAASALSQPDPA